ncbi:MAG TPA: TMEM175 family protein [Polyangia bacterium]|nr:TMEM175 family protein [Polyangia bacterium]
MSKGRLEAFSDGVFAILITILVLELKLPHGDDWQALRPMAVIFGTYVLSFVFLGIYWNNHHHMLHAATRINGRILWANLHLLFWLSLVPFTTAWMGESHVAPFPTAIYGVVLLCAGVGYLILERALIAVEGANSKLAEAVGRDVKANVSALLYAAAIGLAFVRGWIAIAIYFSVAVMWLVPDRRIEARLRE